MKKIVEEKITLNTYKKLTSMVKQIKITAEKWRYGDKCVDAVKIKN